MLKVENLSFVQDGKILLDKVSFTIANNESLAVIGNDEFAKSLLLSCLAGLQSGFTGLIDGIKNSALVLTNPENQFVSFSVEQELAFSLENNCVSSSEIELRVRKTLDDFGLADLAKQPPILLSGGEKQRAVLASMLILEPELLLLNDPCSMLDEKSKAELMRYIFHSGVNQIILATDNTDESMFCSHLLVLDKGAVKFFGDTERIYLEHYKEILSMNFDLPFSILQKLNKSER